MTFHLYATNMEFAENNETLHFFVAIYIYIYIPMFIGINVFPFVPQRFRTAHLNLPFSCHTHYKYVYLHTEIKTN